MIPCNFVIPSVPAQLHKELSHLEVSTGGVDSHVDEKLAATAPAPALHAPDNPSGESYDLHLAYMYA